MSAFSPYVPGTTFGSGEQKRYQFSKLKRNIIRSIDLLVIDEISMVRSDLLMLQITNCGGVIVGFETM